MITWLICSLSLSVSLSHPSIFIMGLAIIDGIFTLTASLHWNTPLSQLQQVARHRWPVNSPYKIARDAEMFPFDDVIMFCREMTSYEHDFIMNGLTSMFRCKFDDLPTECHVNWWTMEADSNSGYFKCLVDSKATTETRGHPLHCQRDARTAQNQSLPNLCSPWISKSVKVSLRLCPFAVWQLSKMAKNLTNDIFKRKTLHVGEMKILCFPQDKIIWKRLAAFFANSKYFYTTMPFIVTYKYLCFTSTESRNHQIQWRHCHSWCSSVYFLCVAD